MMAGQCLGVLHADEQRHTDADQKHEQERHERRRARLGRRIHMAVTHRHAQHEGGQEHLDMNAARLAEQRSGERVKPLRKCKNDDGVEQDRFPVLPQVVMPQFPPPRDQQQRHDRHDDEHLPLKADHRYLQGNHQQDGVQVVENRQHLDLAVHPTRFEVQRRQHREEDTRRGRGGKPAQQQVLLPCFGVAPVDGREHHEHVVERNENPRHGGRGHCDEIVAYIGAPLALFDLELPADVDHDKGQTDVQQRIGAHLERNVIGTQQPRQQLRGDEPQHE